jgi:hypothetical protein
MVATIEQYCADTTVSASGSVAAAYLYRVSNISIAELIDWWMPLTEIDSEAVSRPRSDDAE